MNAPAITRRAVFGLAAALALVAALLIAATPRHAGAQVQNGDTIVFDQCSIVTVQVQDSDALFTSVFWRFGPDTNLGITSQQVGSSVVIGQVPAGEELILGIVVNDTGKTFKTGPGSRNPDGEVHAIVSANSVGFEDKALGEPNADWDYDDAVLSISTEPCPPQDYTLLVQVDPASTGTGTTEGSGTYPAGSNAQAKAIPGAGSSFVTWSGDCAGGSPAQNVLMDANKTCVALFSAVATPTPTPTEPPTATPVPPIAGPEPQIAIANTRTSPSPATIGDTVVFRIDVSLTDVPLTNEAEVLVTFDDTHLDYVGALTSDCALFSVGIVCDFGSATAGFSFDLDFTALAVTDSTVTDATLGADYDGPGAGAPATAGPASADVAIVDVAGIQLPPLGDGSSQGSNPGAGWLLAALGLVAIGGVTGAGAGLIRRRRPIQ
jgi:hypothetical protein